MPSKDAATLNFRTLDLNLLRIFDEVMAERSLTRAARNLAMTQPAVSNALRRLREVVGDELVKRNGYGVEPTPRAQTLWPQVRDALRQLQETLSPHEFVPHQAQQSFVLAMADSTAAELMPGMVALLQRDAPGVSMRLLPLTTRDPRTLLNDKSIDLAVGHFPAVLSDLTARAQSGQAVSFGQQRLYDGEYVCVMRPGHPLADKPLTLDAYCEAQHLLVSFSGRPFGFIDEALAPLGRQRRIVLTVNQFFTAGQVVAHSDLLTVLPRHFLGVTGRDKELVVRNLPMPIAPVHVDALWHHRDQANKGHQWLRSIVAASAARAFGKTDPTPG